ncbi:hypothetical protein Sango_0341500 [Sesamum angolense]|uniref:Uncharacterized protein n=1 Tax=Sesamum angolense TaxID=2727404 RepID=A0AAE1X998_9LAMI|nr:hypothetical protein Sango_0341500 [Sesamum angolense]
MSTPPLQEEQTPATHEEGNYSHWGDEQQMNWVQMMASDAVRPSYFFSYHDGVSDDGTRSCSTDAGPSLYYYNDGPYDYVLGLVDRFYDVVHAADQPLWNGCTQSQLASVAELVNIKTDGHIFKQSYDRISQRANEILPPGHTLPSDYSSSKKLVKKLRLPVEKIDACKNDCMLYWKDDVDLEYCKFYGDTRYKLMGEQDPRRKKSLYTVLRYLPLTSPL